MVIRKASSMMVHSSGNACTALMRVELVRVAVETNVFGLSVIGSISRLSSMWTTLSGPNLLWITKSSNVERGYCLEGWQVSDPVLACICPGIGGASEVTFKPPNPWVITTTGGYGLTANRRLLIRLGPLTTVSDLQQLIAELPLSVTISTTVESLRSCDLRPLGATACPESDGNGSRSAGHSDWPNLEFRRGFIFKLNFSGAQAMAVWDSEEDFYSNIIPSDAQAIAVWDSEVDFDLNALLMLDFCKFGI
ncbi:hypothetical protein J6590_037605 [Homalodisca vitripennis]|nr:hypothetical protein J6590_037605 [Homalodisca vitripennis]